MQDDTKRAMRVLMMMMRTGFLGAMLLGFGALFGLYRDQGAVLYIHIAFGLLFLVPSWLLLGKAPKGAAGAITAGAALATLGAILAAVGAMWAPGLPVAIHIVAMFLGISLIEMGNGRSARGKRSAA